MPEPWNAAALPEIMAWALKESKCRGIAWRWTDQGVAGQQPNDTAGARGGGATEARARPNVEVNRRAEGTSELNRRLGAVEKGAGALERCGAAGDYDRAGQDGKLHVSPWPCRKASLMRLFRCTKAEQQASNWVASPECEGVER